jgi:hypothetical protein
MCNCPSCEWSPPEDFYYCRNGKAVDCTKAGMITPTIETIDIIEDLIKTISIDNGKPKFRIYGKPPFKHLKSYPKIKDHSSSYYASYEFGVDGHTWLEIHKCPACKKEYSFDNSDY